MAALIPCGRGPSARRRAGVPSRAVADAWDFWPGSDRRESAYQWFLLARLRAARRHTLRTGAWRAARHDPVSRARPQRAENGGRQTGRSGQLSSGTPGARGRSARSRIWRCGARCPSRRRPPERAGRRRRPSRRNAKVSQGPGTLAERCRSRWRRRPFDSPPRSEVPHVPYSPCASPVGRLRESGRLGSRGGRVRVPRAGAGVRGQEEAHQDREYEPDRRCSHASPPPGLHPSFGTLTGRGVMELTLCEESESRCLTSRIVWRSPAGCAGCAHRYRSHYLRSSAVPGPARICRTIGIRHIRTLVRLAGPLTGGNTAAVDWPVCKPGVVAVRNEGSEGLARALPDRSENLDSARRAGFDESRRLCAGNQFPLPNRRQERPARVGPGLRDGNSCSLSRSSKVFLRASSPWLRP